MKVKVITGFASINYAGAAGTVLDIPRSEAESLAHSGLVEILEQETAATRPVAFETATAAKNFIKKSVKK